MACRGSASAASAVKGKIRVGSLEPLPLASTSAVLRGCAQVNQQAARTKAVHTASVGIEKMRRFGGRIKHWRSPKDIKSRNKSLGSAESGGRTAAADLKREPMLTTTRARRSRRSDRTETWMAPSRPSARSGNAWIDHITADHGLRLACPEAGFVYQTDSEFFLEVLLA